MPFFAMDQRDYSDACVADERPKKKITNQLK